MECVISEKQFATSREKGRLSNIDLLRTLCSVFVVFEHFCETSAHNAFGFTYNTSMLAHILLRLLYGIARFAVPCFFIISGYLSIESKNQKAGKAVGLFAMVFLYSLIPTLFSYCIQLYKGTFSVGGLARILYLVIPRNYYLYLFVAVYLVSPFVNQAVLKLTKKQYLYLLFICFSLFSIWSTLVNTYIGASSSKSSFVGFFFTSREGTSMGFNVANFLTLYLAGGYLKLHYSLSKKKTTCAFLIILISTIFTTMLKLFVPQYAKAVLYYDSIFITIGSVAFFILYISTPPHHQTRKAQFLSVTGRNTFGVYLIHGFASGIIEHFLSIEKIVSKGVPGTLLGILVFVIGTYFLSLFISVVVSFVFKPLNDKVKKTKIYNMTTLFVD